MQCIWGLRQLQVVSEKVMEKPVMRFLIMPQNQSVKLVEENLSCLRIMTLVKSWRTQVESDAK